MPGRSAARRSFALRGVTLAAVGALACLGLTGVAAAQIAPAGHAPARVWIKPHSTGMLDCNGFSRSQRLSGSVKACTDIHGVRGVHSKFVDDGRFFDNGHYIGHDEPDVRFLSPVPGSGNNAVWHETLGVDPAAAPTVHKPGHDVNHFVELSVAPWFSMALCNPFSYPLLPCTPRSDANAPAKVSFPVPAGEYPGAGSSFLEMQFYPPGQAPFIDNVSCNNKFWCASLHINDAECTLNFLTCNPGCVEPTNFAFIQTNGVPTGPPSPQLANVKTQTPNSHTLMMRSGDHLVIHIWDAPVPGHPGQKALETSIKDLTTGQFGFMQASAANGFMATNITDCSGTPFNYEPEYNTSAPKNIVPWAADLVNVSSQFEIGHFEACSSVTGPIDVSKIIPGFQDTAFSKCHGPYENAQKAGEGAETSDAFCYPRGDTHHGQAPPNVVTGCLDNVFQNGDLDYDGNSYWPDWPTSTRPNLFPSTFLQSFPTSNGHSYSRYQFQTDAALSEPSCTFPSTSGCKVPPPQAPGHFYPYWTLTKACVWEFGHMSNGNSFGRQSQYGSVPAGLGYPQLLGPIKPNRCAV